jgi:hypothetical protein
LYEFFEKSSYFKYIIEILHEMKFLQK